MPFGSITVNSKTFEPRIPGVYALSTVAFGEPSNELRIRGAALSKDKVLRASITRVLEKDIGTGSDVVRKQCIVTTSVAVPVSGFSAAELDVLMSDISEFATGTSLSRILQGES